MAIARSIDVSVSVPPFLSKTYEMVNDPSSDETVSWSLTNNSFVVWKLFEFCRDVLPSYFKHNNFSSFVRQLNFYGFRKVDPDRWEFANEGFLRGHIHLLKTIQRRKASNNETMVILSEMARIREGEDATQAEMQLLEKRMCVAEKRQQQMMSFLAKAMQNPTFFTQILEDGDSIEKIMKAMLLPSSSSSSSSSSKQRKRPLGCIFS